jgi:hypothetical protein
MFCAANLKLWDNLELWYLTILLMPRRISKAEDSEFISKAKIQVPPEFQDK